MRPAAGSSRRGGGVEGRGARALRDRRAPRGHWARRVRRIRLIRRASDRGSATAELALGLPAVVLALVVVLLVGSAALAQVRCGDAARAGARAAALGEDQAAVAALARDLAGEDADVSVTVSDGWARVTVSRPVGTGWLGAGPLTARAAFSVPVEPTTRAARHDPTISAHPAPAPSPGRSDAVGPDGAGAGAVARPDEGT